MTTFKSYMQKVSTKSTPAKKKLQKKVKRPKGAKKGGYPYGTKKGHGGLSGGWYGGYYGSSHGGDGGDGGDGGMSGDGGGGMGESAIQEMQLNMMNSENEEQSQVKQQLEPDDQPNLSLGSDMDAETDMQDPDKQGLLRRVDGAHLVYKRQTENGTFKEMWIYEAGKQMKGELKTKSAILAGTDVDPQTGYSSDGEQSYEIWSAGNAQIMEVSGLPN